jgi:hypothetical protein
MSIRNFCTARCNTFARGSRKGAVLYDWQNSSGREIPEVMGDKEGLAVKVSCRNGPSRSSLNISRSPPMLANLDFFSSLKRMTGLFKGIEPSKCKEISGAVRDKK